MLRLPYLIERFVEGKPYRSASASAHPLLGHRGPHTRVVSLTTGDSVPHREAEGFGAVCFRWSCSTSVPASG